MSISDYLDENLVVFLHSNTQQEALQTLIDRLDQQEKLLNKDSFLEAILQREKIVSTGIGIGVAIPHAKLSGYKDFFIAIGIKKVGGIEWQALDGLPIRLIFLIGGPDDRQTEYLDILSMITTSIRKEETRKSLLKANTPAEVISLFENL